MADVQLSPVGQLLQQFDNNGKPLNGGLLYTYIAGTVTPQATYQDVNGTTPNSNPIELDSAGRPPAEIWLLSGSAYKFVITDSDDNVLTQGDNIIGILSTVTITSSDVTDALGYIPANVAGDTFTGPVYLNSDPTVSAQAATKNYVDSQITDLDTSLTASIAAVGAPTGQIITFPATTTPTGYIACNGAALNRTTYSALFGLIGVTYGIGDGTTTFNIPDLRGVFVRGWDNGRGLDPGRAFASYQADAFQTHDHWTYAPADETFNDPIPWSTNRSVVGCDGDCGGSRLTNSDTTGPNPGTQASETRPKNIALAYFIKY